MADVALTAYYVVSLRPYALHLALRAGASALRAVSVALLFALLFALSRTVWRCPTS